MEYLGGLSDVMRNEVTEEWWRAVNVDAKTNETKNIDVGYTLSLLCLPYPILETKC
jgi:hypothetical protein